MIKDLSQRQAVRKTILLISFLLFPITMNYFSPYVIIDGASQGIVNGSLIMFLLLFASAFFFGRLWCGWACPMGGLGEYCATINANPVNSKKIGWIKWAIWVPWIGLIAWAAISAGGYHSINFILDTVEGISVAGEFDRPIIAAYLIYYSVIGIFAALALMVGRRAGCHAICWMAPFMIIGRKIRNLIRLPALHLQAVPEKCSDCKQCVRHCPMSLDVNAMVKSGKMENSDCILCGNCIDGCTNRAISYEFNQN